MIAEYLCEQIPGLPQKDIAQAHVTEGLTGEHFGYKSLKVILQNPMYEKQGTLKLSL